MYQGDSIQKKVIYNLKFTFSFRVALIFCLAINSRLSRKLSVSCKAENETRKSRLFAKILRNLRMWFDFIDKIVKFYKKYKFKKPERGAPCTI